VKEEGLGRARLRRRALSPPSVKTSWVASDRLAAAIFCVERGTGNIRNSSGALRKLMGLLLRLRGIEAELELKISKICGAGSFGGMVRDYLPIAPGNVRHHQDNARPPRVSFYSDPHNSTSFKIRVCWIRYIVGKVLCFFPVISLSSSRHTATI
jgi:hypothetical protein